MKSIVIVIAIVVSLVMGYLLLARKRSLWPFTKKESYTMTGEGITEQVCTSEAKEANQDALSDLEGYTGVTTSFFNGECTINCPTGSAYDPIQNYCYQTYS
jgi:hypothetical protein